jgi:DNA-binding CsgD family transcriptional regulator
MAKRNGPSVPSGTGRAKTVQQPSAVRGATRQNRSHGTRAVPGKVPRGSLHAARAPAVFTPLSRFILDKLDRGVVLLDAAGAIIDANSLAQKVIDGQKVLAVRNGRLSFKDVRVDERFVRVLDGPAPRPIAATLKQTGGTPPCRVVVVPAQLQGAPREVKFVALIYAAGESRSISGEVLADLYGLTPAQADVARKLYEGRSVEETAAQLELSLNTVRTHLKQIFSKCEVQSQAELLHTLATGPLTL